MPDQTTPITDDDRLAHEWADHQLSLDVNDEVIVTAARAIKAHVPAPPATLADELRYRATLLYNGDPDGDSAAAISTLADRAEAVVKERDEARAEVERLQGTVASQENVAPTLTDLADALRGSTVRNDPPDPADVPPGMCELDRDLPEPADVPKGELWLIRAHGWGGLRVGARNDAEERPDEPWHWMDVDQHGKGQCGDRHVTLVARLVPDTRRVIGTVEGLEALPAGSVVLDKDGDAWQRWDNGMWSGAVGISRSTEMLIGHYGPVTALHVPDATA